MLVRNILLLFGLPILTVFPLKAQIQPMGLQSQKIVSLSVSKSETSPARVLVAASADSGVYFYYLGMDCGWKNLGLKNHDIQDVFVRTEGSGALDFYHIFAGMRQSASDSTLIYRYRLDTDSIWTAADSGLTKKDITSVDDMDGLDYSGHEPPTPLFSAAYGFLFRYDEYWQEIPFEGPFTQFIRVFNDSLIWTGGSGMTMSPVLFKSTDGGIQWQKMDDSLCTFGCDNACYSLAIVPQHADTVYLGMDGHVLKSTDAGAHWQETGLKNIQAGFFGIAVNPLNDLHIVTFSRADTSVVYESFNGGDSWKSIPNPISSFKIFEMTTIVEEGQFILFFATNAGVYQYKTTPDNIHSKQNAQTPAGFMLMQNYPNPFNPATVIRYQLSAVSEIRLDIYNVLGQKVQTLVKERQKAGKYFVTFHAEGLSSGIYYYKLSAKDGFSKTRKMLLIR